jgi:hypothetical protein
LTAFPLLIISRGNFPFWQHKPGPFHQSGEGGIRRTLEIYEETADFSKGGAESGANDPKNRPIDPDLALVVERWDSLPEAVRAGIVAMVKAASAG